MDLLDGMLVGLDGVLEQQPVYESGGFELAFHNARYQGWGGGDVPSGVLGIDDVPMELIVEYDRQCFPAEREIFLRAWLTTRGGSFRALFEGGELRGYGYLRPCRVEYKIGPLFADDPEQAEKLFVALRADAGKSPFFLDTPGNNPEAGELALRHGMKKTFETVRMYSGGVARWDAEKVFGITSFELG